MVVQSRPLRCGDIMRRCVLSVGVADSVADAARLMREQDVGFLPVCSRQGAVAGVLTDRDIVIRACAASEDKSPAAIDVGSIMTAAPVTCVATDDVTRAQKLMGQHRISRVVIVDATTHAPVGILSLSDIAQYIPAALVGRTVRKIAERKYGSERP